MSTFRKTLVATALMGVTAATHADLSFNIGAVSNYLFRGITQTDDQAAVQGGMDYGFDNGIYLGTWMSNVDFDRAAGDETKLELDAYAGYAGEFNIGSGLGYDIGTILYHYPSCGNCDYAEVSGSLSYWWLSGGVAYTYYGETDESTAFDSGDIYYNAAIDIPVTGRLAEVLTDGLGVSIFGGYYDFDNVEEYQHYGLSISKDAGDWGSVSVNVEKTSGDETDDDASYWVGWSKEF